MRSLASRRGVSEMIAVILLVAITVVLTGVLYLVVTQISQQAQAPPPRVWLTTTDTAGGVYTFEVSAADVRPTSQFQIRLWINGRDDPASMINPLAPGTRGNVTFNDLDGGGTVTDGDSVVVRTLTGLRYELYLLWTGQVIYHSTWEP